MTLAIAAGIIACLSYGFAAFLLVRSLTTNIPVSRPFLLGIATIGLVSHAINLSDSLFRPDGMEFGLINVISLFGFVLAACGTLITLFRDIQSLLAPAYPAAAIGVCLNLFMHDRVAPHIDLNGGMVAHILLSVVAYSVIALALSQALLLSIQNYQLKHRHIHDILHLLPPLQTMESTLFDLIGIGLLLLTAAIGSGLLFVEDFFAQHLLHKTVFALAAWLVLWMMIVGRHLWGWRGMVAVRWTLAGFLLLTLAYFGSKFVLEVVLQRV
ncbi:MAG TPA: cytochrome c biogenesis protein CcsA [Dongiaceae bacterium]|nr:cytochrome c biogenesis protein CcsA [Dongiaceae bacterium]